MPCYQVITQSVELKAANLDLLTRAIEGLGHQVSRVGDTLSFFVDGYRVTVQGGRIELPTGRAAIVDHIKRAYSSEVLKTAAARFGWSHQVSGVNKVALTRRAFG